MKLTDANLFFGLITKSNLHKFKRKSIKDYIIDNLETSPNDEDLDMISYAEKVEQQLQTANKKLDEIKEYCLKEIDCHHDDYELSALGVAEDVLEIIEKEV